MERTHKTWGNRCCLFKNDLCEVSVLDLRPSERCSLHTHRTKFNQFYVLKGELFIKTEWGIERIKEGQIFTVKPGEKHEFQTHDQPCLCIEIMYVQYDPEDIQREILGGPLNE
jgi:mannose-6-phosphate isomerase-like protein (cupin superfamily)